MNETPKWGGFVYRHLASRPIRFLVSGVVLSAAGFGGGLWLLAQEFNASGGWSGATAVIDHVVKRPVLLLPGAFPLLLAAYAVFYVLLLVRGHPDVIALRRYGEPRQIVASVDAEMADRSRVLRIGHRLWDFDFSLRGGSSYSAEVYFTPTWIVCPVNRRSGCLSIMRIADIVLAAPVSAPPLSFLFTPFNPHVWVTLIDRHGVRLEMPFPEADARHVLAEVLARIPWAVDRFGPETHSTVIAEAARRREEFRITGRTPPTSPS